MRRLLTLSALSLLVALLPMHAANAEPRVGPPLQLQLFLEIFPNGDGGQDRSAHLSVSGTQCLPQDAPASVIVTLDRLPGQVFTAKPNANGRWSVDIPIDLPIDGVYVVNAECDNYFGTTVYPTATTNADDVIIVQAASGGVGGSSGGQPTPVATEISDPACAFTTAGCVANTGSNTGAEVAIGLGALAAGLLLLLAGRPRRAMQHVVNRDDNTGRHRRTD
jgi:hypothetical protein